MAGMMWAVTKSPAMLMFAGLSPLIAVAGLADARRRLRRAHREHESVSSQQVHEFRAALRAAHAAEREHRSASSTSIRQCLSPSARVFAAETLGQVNLRLGTGARPSSVGVGGSQNRPLPLEQELALEAAVLEDSPVALCIPAVLAIIGPLPLARAMARGLVLQIAATLTPAGGRIVGPTSTDPAWEWLRALPHTGSGGSVLIREVAGGAAAAIPATVPERPAEQYEIFISESMDDVPPECRVSVHIETGSRSFVLESPRQGPVSGVLSPEFVSEHQAKLFAVTLAERAGSSGRGAAELPREVSLAALLDNSTQTGLKNPGHHGLAVPVGSDGAANVILDLVGQGPHAVIGGTTGSGKSELLLSWVTALVCTFSAAELTVLLVDFKGGAAFGSFTRLEQCVGLITDLDSGEAERALGSLRAEIRYREQLLRKAGARNISEYQGQGSLPRLVIVVDEFAVMLAEFPALHDLFADIAARGRSLGMHLILCTQRPVGVIRDTLMANCDLRLSLRVNNAGDSTALIGVPDAAGLPMRSQGRCFVAVGGQDAHLFQVARSSPALLADALRLGREVRRPWLAPLPARIDLDELRRDAEPDEESAAGVIFGRFDRPSEQAQPLARWRPRVDGPLLVLGAGRSGRSHLLAALASGLKSVAWIPPEPAGAWDGLSALFESISVGGSPVGMPPGQPLVVVVDDLDSLIASFEPDYQGEVVRWLTAILRDGSRNGVILIAAAQRLVGPLSGLAPLFRERILLRSTSRAEYLLADGRPADFDPMLAPGEGFWSGTRLKVAVSAGSTSGAGGPGPPDGIYAAEQPETDASPRLSGRLLVVSTRVQSFIAEQGESHGEVLKLAELAIDIPRPTAQYVAGIADAPRLSIVGEPEEWLNHWALFGALRASFDVLFDACTVADYRSLTRRRDLPPPTNPGMPRRWLLTCAGVLGRAGGVKAGGVRGGP